ncbi:hypothetical protein PR001_g30451 [Phytophthora rubi]|uniref:Uncharacterized protein n=1 Tax=Phytophthora rubi TaxID=129364 RepID=A0A6A3GTH1_9STRA|nr:hypothetical protein PR001_g30451 [Phytophthora rubi]
MVGDHAARLETAGTEYRLFPVVHVSKLKLVRQFPDRPGTELTVDEADRLDFDEALLPEDSWTTPLGGYAEPSWVDEADLNCGALMREYERELMNRNRFNVMQSHEGDEE